MKDSITRYRLLAFVFGTLAFTSCNNDDDSDEVNTMLAYDVPATYSFTGADYSAATNRINMAVELNSYLGTGTTVALDQAKVNNMFSNTNAPFAAGTLNTSNINIEQKTADVDVYKNFATQHVNNSPSRNVPATNGTAGFITRGTGKILVGANGIEYNQAVAKGMMGSLAFKEAMNLLAGIPNQNNTTKTNGSTAMERAWDEAFGYLAIPANYDSAKVYTTADVDRPLLWGGYLRERGRKMQAGGILFEAFRKGRAAIGANDVAVRDQQIKIIQDTWEKLAAAAALHYVTDPQKATSVGNLGSQFHALSEGYGFVLSLKHRPAGSKLTQANFDKLKQIMETNYYTLVNEAGFTKLKEAESILKTTYGL